MKKAKALFAYGTLMCDEIMGEVSGVHPQSAPATLPGYRRLRVKDEQYPAVIPDTDGCVDGIIYRSVPPSVWDRLDRFEGEMYAREMVQVKLGDGSTVPAATYVLRPQFADRLDDEEWDFADFLRQGKGSFRRFYKGFPVL